MHTRTRWKECWNGDVAGTQPRFRKPASFLMIVLIALSCRAGLTAAAPESRSGGPGIGVTQADAPRYARSFRTLDGTIYLLGSLKTTDAGRHITVSDNNDPPWGSSLREPEMNSIFYRKGLFLALQNKTECHSDGRCLGKLWRSTDGLKTFQTEETVIVIPEAGKVPKAEKGEWVGLFFHRSILQLPDGSLLAAMYGTFESDKIVPTNPRSKAETKYKSRSFVVRSTDEGRTWRNPALVAAPIEGVVDDTEGFNEWSMVRLDDGRLMGIVRTGHYTPMVAVWSRDNGASWTKPKPVVELGPAADPYLLRLSDGRLVLAYGQIVPPKKPVELYWKEYEKRADHRRRCQLAISADGEGNQWVTSTIADYAPRSAYSTVFEVEPNVLVYQSDLDLWRIQLHETSPTGVKVRPD